MRNCGRLCIVSVFFGLLTWLPAAVLAEEQQHANPGKDLYLKYCSACHGEDAKGEGVVSGLMTPRPTNLTQLAKKNDGTFPFIVTMQIIDGRDSRRAHGDPDMPVWGDIFRATLPSTLDHAAEARGKLILITEHLQSIQQK